MPDLFDRAAEREQQQRDEALARQSRRAGFNGKTVADSAQSCAVCDEPIPPARRAALPGVQTCVECQTDLERALRHP